MFTVSRCLYMNIKELYYWSKFDFLRLRFFSNELCIYAKFSTLCKVNKYFAKDTSNIYYLTQNKQTQKLLCCLYWLFYRRGSLKPPWFDQTSLDSSHRIWTMQATIPRRHALYPLCKIHYGHTCILSIIPVYIIQATPYTVFPFVLSDPL